jgi:RHS repeat-associated protein
VSGMGVRMSRVRMLVAVASACVLVSSSLAIAPAAEAQPPTPGALGAQVVPLGDDGVEVGGKPPAVKALPEVQWSAPVWPAAGTPVSAVAPGKAQRSAAAVAAPSAVVLDRNKVPERWRGGVVARLSGPASVTMNYSAYQYAYGGNWSSRLRLWSMPECALSTPEVAGCTARLLPSTNDEAKKTVTATAGSATGSSLVALAAAPAGDSGDFSATPLSPSSTWSAGGSTGDFTWSYPMRVPAAMGGPQPEVSLSYSSSSVDGRSSATNNQPSWIGEGFEYSPGFIERRYVPCSEDKDGSPNNPEHTGDLCWRSSNATMSLGGSSSELVYEDKKGWHARTEDGSKIERMTGGTNGDDDGEYWKITSTDGTQYFFGLNKITGQSTDTNSTWTVPVYSNHADEPGHASTFHDSRVTQAWRWNLDYAIDTRGNTTSFWYDKEPNQYGAEAKESENVPYVRGGSLARIDYGTWDRGAADRSVTPLAQVVLDRADRCLSDCTNHDGSHWPDTPWDQECKATATECDDLTPTFWSSKRLAKVTTRIWDTKRATPGWQDVDSYTFEHAFPSPEDGAKGGLWLHSIVHAGHVGGTITLPPVTLEPEPLANRVLTKTNTTNNWQRLKNIYTETGVQIQVTYSLAECNRDNLPASPQNNTKRCYPVIGPDPYDPDGKDITEWWHKYVVTNVSQTDTQLNDGHQQPTVNTSYTYQGSPAWHYADDDGLSKPKRKTWDQFRGYATVTTQVGDADKSLTKTTYLRGMHGDRLAPGGGTRTVTVDASLGSETVNDEDQYAGMVREEVVYNGSDDKPVSKTVNVPWRSEPTASRTINGDTVTARYVATKTSYDGTALGADGSRGWRTTSSTTTFDDYGLPTTVQDNGDIATSGDEKCTTTTYNRNTDKNLVATVKRATVKALPCASAPTSAGQIVGDGLSFYDGATSADTPPVHGSLTRADTLKDWTPSGGTVFETTSKATFDDFGRQLSSTDARGNTSTTVFTPAKSLTTTRTLTNQLKWSTTTELDPAVGAPVRVTDPNGRVTDVAYDALGRTFQVWNVGWPRTGNESRPSKQYTYVYDLDRKTYPYIKTEALNAAGGTNVSFQIFDGLLRPRQSQGQAVGGGRVVTDTLYDKHGRAEMTYGVHAEKGDPSGALYWTPEWSVPSQTLTYYDRADRATAVAYRAGDGTTNIVERWRTTTTYEGDRTTVIPPKGGTSTTTVTDTLGRTTEAWQYTTAGASSGAHLTTTYGYNTKDQLTSVKDPAGDEWTMRYDVKGRQIESVDPDKGKTTSTYTAYDDLESTIDARGKILWYTYDSLGRPTAVYDTAPTAANMRSQWIYDRLYTGAKLSGQLTQSIRYDNGNAYKWQAVNFTLRYAVSGENYVIPPSETGLAGTYTYGYNYSATTGELTGMTYPQTGDLTPEGLTAAYDTTSGLPVSLSTNMPNVGGYVAAQDYNAFGQPTVTTSKIASGVYTQQSIAYELDTQRVHQITVKPETAARSVSERVYDWENNGNLLSIADTPQTGDADTQCFGYDPLQRLTSAWTPKAGVACTTAPSTANIGGPAPYWLDWTIDNLGNRTKQVAHTPTGDRTTSYTVPTPGPGVVRPHAVTATSTTEPGQSTPATAGYTYDLTGNMVSRPGQNLTWDSEGKQATIAENGVTTTSNIYNPDGDRIVHRDKTGTTLYLPGQEIKAPAGGGAATTTRYYSFAGKQVATRTAAAQSLNWLFTDLQGTQSLTVNAYTQKVTIRRQQPYGDPRGTAVQWPTLKGFVGGDADASGLTNIGARVYDPVLGRFLSVDPVQDLTDPQQWNGYSYSNNNPSTLSDPSGTRPDCGTGGAMATCNNAVPVAPKARKPGRPTGWGDNNTTHRRHGANPGSSNRYGRHGTKVTTLSDGRQAVNDLVLPKGGPDLNKLIPQLDDNRHLWGTDVDGCETDCNWETLRDVFQACSVGTEQCDDSWFITIQSLRDDEMCDLPYGGGCDGPGLTGVENALGHMLQQEMSTLKPAGTAVTKGIRDPANFCHGNSFSPETLVVMGDGSTKKIADIEVGDKVQATDPISGRTEAREVTATYVNDDHKFTDLTVRNPDGKRAVVHTTQEHPFWDEATATWVDARDLTTVSGLRAMNGSTSHIVAVRSYAGARRMYNLTVEGLHTYYVLSGNTPVLVHNCGRAGLDFNDAERQKVYAANLKANSGVLKCEYCERDVVRRSSERGVPGRPDDAQIDHIEPRAGGGHGGAHNGAVACRRCNRDKSTKPMDVWDGELRDLLD